MIRFDDQAADAHWGFVGRTASGRADHLSEVRQALADAERAAVAGSWVVVAVAYEAAPAFEPAMRVPPPAAGLPLVHWQAFARREAIDPPAASPLPAVTQPVVRRQATGGYRGGVEEIRRRIARGDVYQVNLTDRFGTTGVDPATLYPAMLGSQSCAYGAMTEVDGLWVACASPELFFRWEGDTITCRPMKGTRARHPRAEQDAARAAELVASRKERAENVMIVDLLRSDLGRIAQLGTVRVPELFAVERYETVWQMTSTIRADVPPGTALADVFAALFPCGSVTGAPKISAMSIIADLEAEPRGIYCGAVGYLAPPGAGPRAVFCVPIRTATIDPDGRLTYGAGAGITWASDAAEEDAEVQAKARVLTDPWPPFALLETMRLEPGGILHRRRHLDRLRASAAWFGIEFDEAAVAAGLDALSVPEGRHRVRLQLERNGAFRIDVRALDDAPEPVRLAVDRQVTRSDGVFSCHKTTARSHYEAARRRHPQADDVVLVNEHGHAIETTIASLAYRIGHQWFTPPLTDGGLAGIGRSVALDTGRLTERSIAARDLVRCDELAVVSALRGWRRAELSAP